MTTKTTTHAASPVRTERRWLEDHPGLRRAHVECAEPRSEDELRALLRWAAAERRTITPRGGGQCLHGQSVGDDVVVDLSAFDRVSVDTDAGVVVAGAGARWADVHAALPRGWVLPNVVTTGAASVGGTLVADAASRFSSAFGREAESVRRVRLMTAEGATLDLDRTNPHEELFRALPGSVGMLGVLLSVEHALIDVRHLTASDGSLRVRTVVRKHADARTLLADLALDLRAPPSQRRPRGTYGLWVLGRGGLLFHSMYTSEPRARRMPNHRRDDWLRVAVERGFHIPSVNRALWWTIFTHYYRDGDCFIDDAEDFTFFMDTGSVANALARILGIRTRLVQQVIELPFDTGTAFDNRGAASSRDAAALVEGCERLCRSHGVRPIVWDILPIRGERTHALRLTTALALQRDSDERVAAELLGAQARLAAEHGGRVLHGKGVYADADTMARTMKDELESLARLKERWDPGGVFGGPFYREVLAPAIQRLEGRGAGRPPERSGHAAGAGR